MDMVEHLAGDHQFVGAGTLRKRMDTGVNSLRCPDGRA